MNNTFSNRLQARIKINFVVMPNRITTWQVNNDNILVTLSYFLYAKKCLPMLIVAQLIFICIYTTTKITSQGNVIETQTARSEQAHAVSPDGCTLIGLNFLNNTFLFLQSISRSSQSLLSMI